jgi:LacI family transcriptional regulator
MRLVVPEDLSVVRFDDVSPATVIAPALTTVRQPAEMGRAAARVLNGLMRRQRLESLQVELATRLVVRESNRAAPG